jgi:prophage regulatory protein
VVACGAANMCWVGDWTIQLAMSSGLICRPIGRLWRAADEADPVGTGSRVVWISNLLEAVVLPTSRRHNVKLIRIDQVIEMTGLTSGTLARLEARGQFPRRRHLSARTIAWIEEDVLDWVRQRIDPTQAIVQGRSEASVDQQSASNPLRREVENDQVS